MSLLRQCDTVIAGPSTAGTTAQRSVVLQSDDVINDETATIGGRLVTAAGEPLGHVYVHLEPEDDWDPEEDPLLWHWDGWTDAAGGFRFSSPPDALRDGQTVLVRVERDQRTSWRMRGPRGQAVVKKKREDEFDLGTVAVTLGQPLLAGRLVGPDGQPVRDAWVEIPGSDLPAQTDGSFTLHHKDLWQDEDLTVRAHAPGYYPRQWGPFAPRHHRPDPDHEPRRVPRMRTAATGRHHGQ